MTSHPKDDGQPRALSRRAALRSLGLAAVAVPLGKFLVACGESASATAIDATAGASGAGGAAGVGGSAGTAGAAGEAAAGSGGSGATLAWATGGTKAMAGGYPDPFASGLGETCELTCSATLGPCYAKTVERKDISEGQAGLPTRLSLKVVDTDCKPIAGATVDIWHCAPNGIYSGDDSIPFCNANDPEALASRWFRGVQTTDAEGRVDFDTCFPGWYSSRTIHIHFTIRIGDTEYVTSQLVFDDTLDDEIVNTQPLYDARGPRDTTNATDTVVSAESAKEVTLQTQQMSDGALLAWKTLVIRTSTAQTLCQLAGGSAPGGGGGPPPDGGGPGGPPPNGRAAFRR